MSIYVFSDLHGRYDLWKKICARVQPNDWLISLGDNIDRGPDGYKIWESIFARERTIAIKGNHEQMAIDAIPYLLEGKSNNRIVQQWFANGGEITWNSMKTLSSNYLKAWIDTINKLETDYYFTNEKEQTIILDHAGFTLGREDIAFPLWDREHFRDKWPKENKNFDPTSTFLIHGHTPVQFLYFKYGVHNDNIENDWVPAQGIDVPQKPNICRYCEGHKFDIDLGSYASNRTALIDIDTFEVIYIE